MLCTRCGGSGEVHLVPYVRNECPECEGSGEHIEADQRATLKPPPKPPDDRPTPAVALLPCPECLEGQAPKKIYRSPHTLHEWVIPCSTCRGALHVHPAVALEFTRRR